jgi:hypothetical protein
VLIMGKKQAQNCFVLLTIQNKNGRPWVGPARSVSHTFSGRVVWNVGFPTLTREPPFILKRSLVVAALEDCSILHIVRNILSSTTLVAE